MLAYTARCYKARLASWQSQSAVYPCTDADAEHSSSQSKDRWQPKHCRKLAHMPLADVLQQPCRRTSAPPPPTCFLSQQSLPAAPAWRLNPFRLGPWAAPSAASGRHAISTFCESHFVQLLLSSQSVIKRPLPSRAIQVAGNEPGYDELGLLALVQNQSPRQCSQRPYRQLHSCHGIVKAAGLGCRSDSGVARLSTESARGYRATRAITPAACLERRS